MCAFLTTYDLSLTPSRYVHHKSQALETENEKAADS